MHGRKLHRRLDRQDVTDIAGCSDWFDCGLAAYSYEAKQALLGVRPETLDPFGAVSRETVLEMVSGALITPAPAWRWR